MPDCLPCLEKDLKVVPATAVVDGKNLCDRHAKMARLRAMKNARMVTFPPDENAATRIPNIVADVENGKVKNVRSEVDWKEVQRDRDAGLSLSAVIVKYQVSADDVRRNTNCPKKENSMKDYSEAQKLRDGGMKMHEVAAKTGISLASLHRNLRKRQRKKPARCERIARTSWRPRP